MVVAEACPDLGSSTATSEHTATRDHTLLRAVQTTCGVCFGESPQRVVDHAVSTDPERPVVRILLCARETFRSLRTRTGAGMVPAADLGGGRREPRHPGGLCTG